jgi:hypothetical protein
MKEKVCKICLLEHDEEIHEATLSVHAWLKYKVERSIARPIVEDLSTAA